MNMKWKEEHRALKEYIVKHAEIVINTSEVSIPQELRDEFYRRFDELRTAFVEDHNSSLTVDCESLCENFLQIEKEVMEILSLDEIAIPVDLHSFLHRPKDGLIRILYNRTFDLLQGKTTIEEYETQASADLQSMAQELFRLGYEQWAALTFIKLLDPDEAFLVDLDEDYKPVLAELKSIAFGRQAHHPTMRIPEFVLHSRKLDKYVAVKMVLSQEIETFAAKIKPPVRPKKKTGDTSFALDSRAMLLSFMEKPENIPVIADIYDLKLTSPDWMMAYISANELEDSYALEQVARNLESLKPARGGCLLIIGSEDASLEGVPQELNAASVGFDQSKLLSIVDRLALEA